MIVFLCFSTCSQYSNLILIICFSSWSEMHLLQCSSVYNLGMSSCAFKLFQNSIFSLSLFWSHAFSFGRGPRFVSAAYHYDIVRRLGAHWGLDCDRTRWNQLHCGATILQSCGVIMQDWLHSCATISQLSVMWCKCEQDRLHSGATISQSCGVSVSKIGCTAVPQSPVCDRNSFLFLLTRFCFC